jgi:hypothetical protein
LWHRNSHKSRENAVFQYEMSKARIAELHREADLWRLARVAQAGDAAYGGEDTEGRVIEPRAGGALCARWALRRPRGAA